MEEWLSARAERKVRIVVPQRGDRRRLVDLATRNAELSYRARHEHGGLAQAAALEQLQQALQLPALPRRIECIDISTLQGSETVASLVVCEDGRMAKGEYRKFRVSGPGPGLGTRRTRCRSRADACRPAESAARPRSPVPSPEPRFLDDFAAMEQVVRRRYAAVVEAGGPFPDLLVIDGGKGQLSAAYAALERVGLSNLVAVGLAKKEELVFTRDHDEPIALDRTGPALHLLQRIRDEAHRFAVTFHRKSRAKRDFTSELDAIAGVGRAAPQRAAAPLRQRRRRAAGDARRAGAAGRPALRRRDPRRTSRAPRPGLIASGSRARGCARRWRCGTLMRFGGPGFRADRTLARRARGARSRCTRRRTPGRRTSSAIRRRACSAA